MLDLNKEDLEIIMQSLILTGEKEIDEDNIMIKQKIKNLINKIKE